MEDSGKLELDSDGFIVINLLALTKCSARAGQLVSSDARRNTPMLGAREKGRRLKVPTTFRN